jgi:hypothetical protein
MNTNRKTETGLDKETAKEKSTKKLKASDLQVRYEHILNSFRERLAYLIQKCVSFNQKIKQYYGRILEKTKVRSEHTALKNLCSGGELEYSGPNVMICPCHPDY